MEGFPWCRKIVDDILIWAPSLQDLEERLHSVLRRCSDLHITLFKSKFQIANSLKFAGCVVSDKGVQPDPDRISYLTNFPTPTDQIGVRSFLGLCNQLAFFSLITSTTPYLCDNSRGRDVLSYGSRSINMNSIPSNEYCPATSSSVILTHRKTSSFSPMLPLSLIHI